MDKKVILITGASSGIGFQAARMLADRGHIVYGAARRVEKINADGVRPLRMDVTDDASMEAGVRQILSEEGRIDVLVNNAGYGYFGPIETVSMEEARRQLEVNVFGLARLTQLVLPHMRSQQSGRIVNVSSVAGKSVLYFGGWYHVSKYAVEAFSDALRMEVKPLGINVSIIEPGAIRTQWGIIAADNLEASTKGTAYEGPAGNEASLMRKSYSASYFTQPEKIAAAIVKAACSRRPRTRYRLGFGSRTLLFFHHLLPDRWWDATMRMAGQIHL